MPPPPPVRIGAYVEREASGVLARGGGIIWGNNWRTMRWDVPRCKLRALGERERDDDGVKEKHLAHLVDMLGGGGGGEAYKSEFAGCIGWKAAALLSLGAAADTPIV